MESQNIEWKEKWHDEYLRTVCAFANAHGGVIEIGRTDKGVMVGVPDARKLLETLPNKLRNSMGVVADIDLAEENGNQFLRVSVKPYPYPISCNGKYYYRSGSTTQELTGNALDEFLLRKQGKTWDGVPVPRVAVRDFESDAFKIFRKKAIESTRMTEKDLQMSDEVLLDSLRLTEGSYLRRAALLLFHQDAEKWAPGAYVKIGKFANDTDLVYQHEVHGSLVSLPDKVMEVIYLNYFKGIISYNGIQRVETYPVPHAAFREAITNAIAHRDYSTGIPIQIKVFDDRVIIYNDGRLPEKWTIEDLFVTHRSEPHNPLIANAFFRAGMIESWGRGIEKITETCKEAGKPAPVIEYKRDREFSVTFFSDAAITENITKNNAVHETQKKILAIMATNPTITAKALSAELGIADRNIKNHIKALKDAGLIKRVGAAKGGHWVVKQEEA
ncbi:MAG: putative DNA binding domain-containing protein [Clostridium sp.]|nr:putative DNA binding domain-containing protein [Clostridium sp.]